MDILLAHFLSIIFHICIVLTVQKSFNNHRAYSLNIYRAEVAAKHAETHFKLLTSFADSTKLNLTKLDDEIYKHFRQVS